MTKAEIVQAVANIHNSMVQIQVSGDSAIAMGGALIGIRQLVERLQKDVQAETDAEEAADACEGAQ